jgi:methylenetetrahydrofolate dehydrogenase (NADP+)/methenyltetrahydrofolate cyclohydrolase
MTAIILDGRAKAQSLLAKTATKSHAFSTGAGRAPCLALLTMEQGPAAQAYVKRIQQFAEASGVDMKLIQLPTDAPLDQLLEAIHSLNDADTIDAILPLAPFPPQIVLADIAAVLSPAKDVDGLTPHNAGQLACGLDGLFPCTPQAAIALAEEALGSLRGLNATVVGASANVGRPLATLLLRQGATVTIAHADTRDLAASCRTADLLFVAVGKPGLIGAAHIAAGTTIIDIGINALDDGHGGKTIVGDVDLAAATGMARAISAVPDGVGPLTTAFLVGNAVRAAEQLLKTR